MTIFAKNILFLRKKNGYTQAEMPARIDITRATWSNYENCVSEPDIAKIIEIAKFFGVSIDYLLLVDLERNVHLIDNNSFGGKSENVHLNVHPNVPEEIKLPLNIGPTDYRKLSDRELNYLFLRQLNHISDELAEIRKSLDNP